ncbi:MAG: SPOR domain-containing protein [Xanthobacteraceae bacterium]
MPRLYVASLVVLGLAASACAALAQDAAGQPAPSVMQAPLEKSRAAIAECREKRLRKELASYKESAECSNRQIFAAWKEANYPHMDLITAWLNAREAASEKVDQHAITPKEFEREMDEITVRLTAEERRRRSGLVAAGDNEMELQLPPATQVVGVATPPGQDKLAAKKGAAARARAGASDQPVELSPGASVGSMGSLSPLEKPKTPAGVGGPFVPVNPNSPAARAALARAAAAAAPGEGSSGLYAHLSSQRSEAEARLAFRTLQAQYPDILAGRDAVIRRADDPSQGTYYRVEIGPLSAGQADELCGSLKAARGQCVPRYE